MADYAPIGSDGSQVVMIGQDGNEVLMLPGQVPNANVGKTREMKSELAKHLGVNTKGDVYRTCVMLAPP